MADENGVVLPGDEGVLQERSRARMYTLVAMRSWKTWHIKQGIERKRVYSHEEMIRSLRDGVNTLKFCTIHC